MEGISETSIESYDFDASDINTDTNAEAFLDYEPYIYQTVIHIITFPLGFISTIANIAVSYFALMYPDSLMPSVGLHFMTEYDCSTFSEITPYRIEKESLYNSEQLSKPVTKKQLYRTLEKVQLLAKALNISQEIKVYTAETENVAFTIGSSLLTQKTLPIFISPNIITQSDEALDFVLGHELSHIAHNDLLVQLIFNVSVLAFSIFTFVVSPLFLPLVFGGSFLASSGLKKAQETLADRSSILINQTPQGALDFFSQLNDEMKILRIRTISYFQDNPEKYFSSDNLKTKLLRIALRVFSKKTVAIGISPEGNNRYDFDHPSLTWRIAFAENFLKNQEVSDKVSF